MTHTPGPWIACKGTGYYVTRPKSRCAHVVGVCNRTLLVDGDCEAEAAANARLIAAAPKMFAILKYFDEFVRSGEAFMYPLGSLQDIRETIAEVEGTP